jgi:preprotein translocase subunit SecF
MEFFHKQTKIDFMKIRGITAVLSAAMIVLSIAFLVFKGINWGLDFTGGIIVEVSYTQDAPINKIRESLKASEFHDAVVQTFGSPKDVVIKLGPREKASEKSIAEQIIKILTTDAGGSEVELKRVDAIGSQVGKELAWQGWMAIIVAVIAITVYIALRFEKRFAISAAVALAHDPIVILGIFSLYQVEFDLTTLAAMLAVIGYSLNDTVVIFDRIKENFIKIRKTSSVDLVNLSINQTLSRTIITSGVTLLVVVALLIFGGPTLYGFSLALFIGIIVGTYSSIYIAGALAVVLGLDRHDLLPAKKKVDDLP